MSVKIDPSEVRERSPAAKPARRLPWRKIVIGAAGTLGLVGFAFGASSFFEGLADPRTRTPRPKPVAINLPDLKDGIPALAPESGTASQAAAPAPVLNLPRPPVSEPQRVTESDPAPPPARQAAIEVAPPAPGPSAADATGSVSGRPATASAVRPTPQIENAQTVAPDAKPVPLIAPARTETVKAKPSETRSLAALPAEPDAAPAPAAAKAPVPHKASEPKRVETKPATPKPAPTRTAKAAPARPIVEASAEPAHAPAPRPQAEESDGIVAGVKNGWNAGMKAVGGMFGGE